MRKKKIIRSAIFIIPIILIFSQCIRFKSEDPRGNTYAGSASCMSCHKSISSSYLHTAHFIASQPASANTIQGSFATGANEFVFNPHLKVIMNKRDSGYYQTSYLNGKVAESQRFDISFGGIKGQTYAYWVTNELFQLPISYNNIQHSWINSPGYDPNQAFFSRSIGIQCMDCHASFVRSQQPDIPGYYNNNEGFEKRTLIYGIDCERCHGPAAEHVKFETGNTKDKTGKYITSIQSLTREQKINMCAICHSGANNHMLKPSFLYKPGDTLSNYMAIFNSNAPVNFKVIDVHGNQSGLLKSSKCFIGSKLDCSTCHNTHTNERNNNLLFASRCITCHNNTAHLQCKLINKLSTSVLMNNCIACHMPAFASKLIIAGKTGAQVHTHHIAIYPEETQKILAFLNSKNKKIK